MALNRIMALLVRDKQLSPAAQIKSPTRWKPNLE
jgi:hypothetical protein